MTALWAEHLPEGLIRVVQRILYTLSRCNIRRMVFPGSRLDRLDHLGRNVKNIRIFIHQPKKSYSDLSSTGSFALCPIYLSYRR